MEFIGRKKELEDLNLLLRKKSASLVVIRGRRRIGKSRLIQEFVKFFRIASSNWNNKAKTNRCIYCPNGSKFKHDPATIS